MRLLRAQTIQCKAKRAGGAQYRNMPQIGKASPISDGLLICRAGIFARPTCRYVSPDCHLSAAAYFIV
ncbi:hypothetical protein [Neisseria dumasiana]|uniref:hypothetical protein n=1 Tax=Neisseria dumasiana TaxID=1931275 RepID=UPI001180F436|nr:hypothetical protein [Neisseria dumasiana]UOO84136.1 hypothetical protein LVJ88_10735 [Neisseria dumasiana]